jgi:hypothetical protein
MSALLRYTVELDKGPGRIGWALVGVRVIVFWGECPYPEVYTDLADFSAQNPGVHLTHYDG